MSLIIRFSRHDSGMWLVSLPAMIAYLIYRYPSPKSATVLLASCILFFCLSYPVRSKVVLNYIWYRRPLSSVLYFIVATALIMRIVGHYQIFQFAMAAYLSLILGLVFWAASDPVFEMVQWLAHPLEQGRVPDEICLVDTRMLDWPGSDFKIRTHLFRFRYGNEIGYGITGPITFALGDQDFKGKSPDDIYAAYREWFTREDIDGMLQSKLKDDSFTD